MDARNAPMPAEPMPAAGDDVEELRRQVEALRLENAVMRETINVLKADDPRLDESDPLVVSEKVVRRIMREGAMRPVYLKRPKRWSSYAGEIGCVCSIESGPCERVDVFHVSGRFWSTSACGEKRTPARPAWTSFPS